MKTLKITFLILLLLLSITNACAAAESPPQPFVMASRAPILSEPSLSSHLVGYIEQGEIYEILSETTVWLFIRKGEITGYVPKLFIGSDAPAETAWIITEKPGERAALRKTPYDDGDTIGFYYSGTKVFILIGGNQNYVRVRIVSSESTEGFINKTNLSDPDMTSVPIEKPVLIGKADDKPYETLGIVDDFYHTPEGFVKIDSLSKIIDSRIVATEALYIMSDEPNKQIQLIDTGYSGVVAIRILNENHETEQLMASFCAVKATSPYALIIEDVNFDGVADIRIASHVFNETYIEYSFWLYDSKSDSFTNSIEFDMLGCDPTFDAQNKKIHVLVENDDGEFVDVEYDVVSGLPLRTEHSY